MSGYPDTHFIPAAPELGQIQARVNVSMERYIKDLEIECTLLLRMIDTMVLPAGSGYLGELCQSIAAVKSAIGKDAAQTARANEMHDLLAALTSSRDALAQAKKTIDAEATDEHDLARRYAGELSDAMGRTRAAADGIEELCGDGWWPLPSYQEMLFIR